MSCRVKSFLCEEFTCVDGEFEVICGDGEFEVGCGDVDRWSGSTKSVPSIKNAWFSGRVAISALGTFKIGQSPSCGSVLAWFSGRVAISALGTFKIGQSPSCGLVLARFSGRVAISALGTFKIVRVISCCKSGPSDDGFRLLICGVLISGRVRSGERRRAGIFSINILSLS